MTMFIYSHNPNRKLTAIRRSLHNAFISKRKLNTEITKASSGLVLDLFTNALRNVNDSIARLRIDEGMAISREFTNMGVLHDEAYPIKKIRNKVEI
jgi:hypothetical protein